MSTAVFYNQPIAHRFGTELASTIESQEWDRLEVAVAWVRQSAMRHLNRSIASLLTAGGVARFTVGVDVENTSREGLEGLLGLQSVGDSETYIYHNEANGIFHPKVYFLQNAQRSCLMVGSNNLTQASLFVNTEAGLRIETANDDPVIIAARMALASWRDPTTGFVKRLDDTLLSDLVARGYVLSEASTRERRASSESSSRARRGSPGQALFRALGITVPPPPTTATVAPPGMGTVLLMRVRRASETERRTQIQIPIRAVETPFFSGISHLTSAHDGRTHAIITASARGARNTMKVEVPEIDPFVDPVIRLERTASEVVYQAFDAESVLGFPIMEALRRGLSFEPPQTFLTLPGEPSRATWWRFI